MSVNDLIFVQGWDDTRAALRRWNERPGRVLLPWIGLSAAIALFLLLAVYTVAKLSPADPSGLDFPGVNRAATWGDYGHILYRNGLVLALHAMACVAGFIAGAALPLSAAHRTGVSRWVHDKAGPLAIAFVIGATIFSLSTQAFIVGGTAATYAAELHMGPGKLLLGLLPHALPELTALFLPLAAWIIASRRGDWNQLLAATFVTVGISIPLLLIAALVEVRVSPELIRGLAGL
jgi:hypothetical protein